MFNIKDLKKEDFDNIPKIKWDEGSDKRFNSIFIIPTNELHDSGFQFIRIVGIDEDNKLYELSDFSDVIHINGIGGYGDCDDIDKYKNRITSQLAPIQNWLIDIIPCGYIRLFNSHKMYKGHALSDFELFAEERK